jgi:ribonucleoside-diphosphate reductase alpha chain
MRTPAKAAGNGRDLERADRVVVVSAPTTWTDARVEAWLDWAGGEIDPEAPLGGGPARYAERLAQAGLTRGLFGDKADAGASATPCWPPCCAASPRPPTPRPAWSCCPTSPSSNSRARSKDILARRRSHPSPAGRRQTRHRPGPGRRRRPPLLMATPRPAPTSARTRALARAARKARDLGADDRTILGRHRHGRRQAHAADRHGTAERKVADGRLGLALEAWPPETTPPASPPRSAGKPAP